MEARSPHVTHAELPICAVEMPLRRPTVAVVFLFWCAGCGMRRFIAARLRGERWSPAPRPPRLHQPGELRQAVCLRGAQLHHLIARGHMAAQRLHVAEAAADR